MIIKYLKGDATSPLGDDHRIIVHICNDIGKWGRGFVLAISKRWKEPRAIYENSFQSEQKPALGDVQFIQVSNLVTVANIIGQHGIRSPGNKSVQAPIKYDAVRSGLDKIAKYAVKNHASIHMPRIGCGLAGGTWEEIEPVINNTLIINNIEVSVYNL